MVSQMYGWMDVMDGCDKCKFEIVVDGKSDVCVR